MRLYVPAMDAVLLDFRADGQVRFEREDWSVPTLQEVRAILHAAQAEVESLRELVEVLERQSG